MPGTGPLRRSSVLARKKAIVGKSLVEGRPWGSDFRKSNAVRHQGGTP
jgi:hypothetical protein